MATRYPSDYDSHSRVEPGISRGSRSASSARAGGSRSGYSGQRPASRGTASRSASSRSASSRPGYSGQRSASGQRAPQRAATAQRNSYAQRPPQRSGGQPRRNSNRGRRPNRLPAFAALAAVLVVVLVLVIAKPFGRGNPDRETVVPVAVTTDAQPGNDAPDFQGEDLSQEPDEGQTVQYDNLADQLADSDYDVGSLSAEEMAQVSDLKVNTGLPQEWLNVLLLGTDERTLGDSARTDAIIICSINRNTGEVKLTSIMRDLAVELDDIGKYSGTYRINAANFFGGPNLAMRTVNECFDMNIQYYVMVNYFGFQKIAQRLGGIDIDITEAEKDKINEMVYEQAKFAYKSGVDESDQENVYLETYGENTHLNGRMTLAYARIRKLTGGDAMRTERQRIVLEKLLEKVKGLDAIQMAALASDMIGQVKTNLPFDDMFALAMTVVGNGVDVKDLRLPLANTYKEESRNDQSMLYDCDWKANALGLYNFIYES